MEAGGLVTMEERSHCKVNPFLQELVIPGAKTHRLCLVKIAAHSTVISTNSFVAFTTVPPDAYTVPQGRRASTLLA